MVNHKGYSAIFINNIPFLCVYPVEYNKTINIFHFTKSLISICPGTKRSFFTPGHTLKLSNYL